MTIKTITDDILNANGCYIAHQCNCLSVMSAGLARTIFRRYPEVNDYRQHETKRIPGTVNTYSFKECKTGPVGVINMFSQVSPGRSVNNNQKKMRLELFNRCLHEIATTFTGQGPVTIAFPYKIGCGLAGGDWHIYLDMLEKFNQSNRHINVVIFRREHD